MKTVVSPKRLISLLQGKPKVQIKHLIGDSKYHSEFNIWAYDIVKNLFFRREMILFFSDNIVIDIMIIDYFFGNKIKEYHPIDID